MKRRELLTLAAMGLVALPARALASGIPVFDGANLAQNILTAIRTLTSNINEATMIANQVKQLANDLKNLTKLEFSIVDEFNSELHELFAAVGEVQGLMQDFANLNERFEELYPDLNNLGILEPSVSIAAKANEWLNESREMVRGAALTGAKALEALPTTQAELDKLLIDSGNAVGILQAAQAGNQIAATVSGNLMRLSAQLATYSQAHMAYLQKENSKEAAVKNRLNHVLDGLEPSSEPPVPLSPF